MQGSAIQRHISLTVQGLDPMTNTIATSIEPLAILEEVTVAWRFRPRTFSRDVPSPSMARTVRELMPIRWDESPTFSLSSCFQFPRLSFVLFLDHSIRKSSRPLFNFI